MAFHKFLSTDASAPAGIDNVAGTYIAVLDACLVNGYGAKSPIGWSIAYTAANLRTYRSNVGSQLYFGFSDDGTTQARLRLGQTASGAGAAAANFIYPTPTDAQISGGLYISKSTAAAARAWRVYSNGKIIYVFVDYAGTGNFYCIAFGDLTSYYTTDTNCSVVIGGAGAGQDYRLPITGARSGYIVGHYLSRKYDGITYSVQIGKLGTDGCADNNFYSGYTNPCAYPDPATNGLRMMAVKVMETYSSLVYERGRLPGLWFPLHSVGTLGISTGDTLSGLAGTSLEGRTFEFVKTDSGGGYSGCVLIETSDTWDDVNFK